MKNHRTFRLMLCFILIIIFPTACGAPSTTVPSTMSEENTENLDAHSATPEANIETIDGEISDFSMLGQMNINFSGTFEGISFNLKQQPEKTFKLYLQSFDEAIELGIMSEDSQGWVGFENLIGWNVEITYETIEEEGGGYKVLSFNGIGLHPTDTGTSTSDSSSDDSQPIEYIVKVGDTCAGIALYFNISQESLIAANNLSDDCSNLSLGQKIIIPTTEP